MVVTLSCILSKFYIKPQLKEGGAAPRPVVSYRNSTSNHNSLVSRLNVRIVVSYRNSTSNHNIGQSKGYVFRLYLIEILHQTTTGTSDSIPAMLLYLIEILHQTTTVGHVLLPCHLLYLIEILHQTTTSGLILIDKVLLTGCLPL